jgi:hypothetical protein
MVVENGTVAIDDDENKRTGVLQGRLVSAAG